SNSRERMRAIVARGPTLLDGSCNGRGLHELLLSPPDPVRLDGPIPVNVEAMAWDPVAGGYRVYALESGRWSYFGDSGDMLEGPVVRTPDGIGGTVRSSARRCANCHAGGGPVMKEMRDPWMNWEDLGTRETPGAKELVSQLKDAMGETEIRRLDGRSVQA